MEQHKYVCSLATIHEEIPSTFWIFDCDTYTPKPKPMLGYIYNHSVEDLFNIRARIVRKTNLASTTKTLSLRRFVLQRNTHISFEKYIINNYPEIIDCDGQISYFVGNYTEHNEHILN